jgi:hypothetical protein
MKVIALLHAKPDEIPFGKSETNPGLRARLTAFREKVAANRLVKMWNNAEELPGLVALSLNNAIKNYPAVGWIRADRAANETLLGELNEVRKDADQLRKALTEYQAGDAMPISNLAGLDETYRFYGTHVPGRPGTGINWSVEISWRDVFALIGPYLQKYPNDESVHSVLAKALSHRVSPGATYAMMDDQLSQTVRIQVTALGLVKTNFSKTTAGGMALFWSLTKAGERLLLETRTVRAKARASDVQLTDEES